MDIGELKAMNDYIITPTIAAEYLKRSPYNISVAARDCPESIGFPTSRIGTRTLIPRLPFIRFLEDGGPWFERNMIGGVKVYSYEYYKAQLMQRRDREREREVLLHNAEKACYAGNITLEQFFNLCDQARGE